MAKNTSKSKQAQYTQYQSNSKWASNRKRKLERQLKLQPNNSEQIKLAISNISYRRKTPKIQAWSHSNIRMAMLFKLFTGKASPELFSSNQKTQSAALHLYKPSKVQKVPEGKVSFLLAARAHDKQGNLVWA